MCQPASLHNRLELVLDHDAAGQGTSPQIKHWVAQDLISFSSKLLGYFPFPSRGIPSYDVVLSQLARSLLAPGGREVITQVDRLLCLRTQLLPPWSGDCPRSLPAEPAAILQMTEHSATESHGDYHLKQKVLLWAHRPGCSV